MPTSNYTANKDAVQSPSPAPAPRAVPIISIPGGDVVRTIESITQQMKAKADFLGHIQSAVGLDVPVLNSGTSGFTAPSYSAFGGTVAPTGGVHIADGTRFVIQIQLGGAVGVATFKTSIDGGNTYGALQTTSASMTDATSGITLAFAGTLTAAGTATFRSAFTPLAEWRNSGGSLRSIIDHNGYPTGRRSEFREEWANSLGSQSVTANPITNNPKWQVTIANSATLALAGTTTTYPAQTIQLSATSAASSKCSLATANALFSSSGTLHSIVVEFELALGLAAVAGQAAHFGIGNNADFSSSVSYAWFRVSGTGHWLCETAAGGAATSVDSGVTPVVGSDPSGGQLFRVELHGSASPYGQCALFFINGALVAVSTTNIPSVSALVIGMTVNSLASGAAQRIQSGPIYSTWNRFLSLSTL
jgi:hypothetical protein